MPEVLSGISRERHQRELIDTIKALKAGGAQGLRMLIRRGNGGGGWHPS